MRLNVLRFPEGHRRGDYPRPLLDNVAGWILELLTAAKVFRGMGNYPPSLEQKDQRLAQRRRSGAP
ncbi:hypothetical protein KCP69_25375 [Salmonella enterica subsp. enterica]|nr:hypothetical protein KCP69_25375 [Salmonella enterica subsp. enterica]